MSVEFKIDTRGFEKLVKDVEKKLDRLPDEIGSFLVKEFKDKFNTKEWNNESWPQSLNNNNTLVDTHTLQNGINYTKTSKREVEIYNDAPYAEIHNTGGQIYVTEKMKSFFWSQWYQTQNDFWKWCALKQIGDVIVIPKRKFMGMDDRGVMDRLIEHLKNNF